MNDILREYLDLIAVGILDDVIVFSESLSDHVPHVRFILEVLRQHKLYAKVEKCEFHKDQMTFVGYLVSQEGIGMDPAKVSAVLDWPTPTTVKEVQSYLGFANFYRKFINNYFALTTPLTSLTRKAAKFVWSPAAEEAFPNSATRLNDCSNSATFSADPTPDDRSRRLRLRTWLHSVPALDGRRPAPRLFLFSQIHTCRGLLGYMA